MCVCNSSVYWILSFSSIESFSFSCLFEASEIRLTSLALLAPLFKHKRIQDALSAVNLSSCLLAFVVGAKYQPIGLRVAVVNLEQ